jgi:fluoride ion exporter CrcB/FEX
MGIGISVLVGAIGAILRYAFTGPVNQQGFDLHTGGVILMFVGALGLVLSMLFWSSFAPFGRSRSTSRREEVVSRGGEVQGTRVVRETQDVSE